MNCLFCKLKTEKYDIYEDYTCEHCNIEIHIRNNQLFNKKYIYSIFFFEHNSGFPPKKFLEQKHTYDIYMYTPNEFHGIKLNFDFKRYIHPNVAKKILYRKYLI